MKKQQHRIIIILCCCFSLKAATQNLVSNPSFEDTLACPTNGGQIENAIGWNSPTHVGSSAGFPDYYNSCANSYGFGINNVLGNQNPKAGNGYAGLYTYYYNTTIGYYREYMQVHLSDSLEADKTYCVSFYTSLAEEMQYNCNNIGMYFSADSTYTTDTILTYTPQIKNDLSNSLNDKINWTMVSDSFVAAGGEKYIIIGNFDLPADLDTFNNCVGCLGYINGAYYYIDDVSVEEVLNANAGNDTSVVSMDSVRVGNNPTENATYLWQPAIGLSDVNAPNPMVWTSNTTTYIATKTQCSVITTDTVTVYSSVGIDQNTKDNHFKLFPNPNNGKMTLDYSLNSNDKGEILIYDITGKLIISYSLDNKINQLSINNQQLNNGIYFYHIEVNNKIVKSDKLVIIK